MRSLILSLLSLGALLVPLSLPAETPEDFRTRAREEMEAFRRDTRRDYDTFRRKVTEDYARFMENPWVEIESHPALTPPFREVPPPEKVDPKSPPPTPLKPESVKKEEPLPIVPPQPLPPEKIEPIRPSGPTIDFEAWGINVSLPDPGLNAFRMEGGSPQAYAQALRRLGDSEAASLAGNLLALRSRHRLHDWAYLRLLDRTVQALLGPNAPNDEKTLLLGFLLFQSGYDIRFASDALGLVLLYYTDGTVYYTPRFQVGSHMYYAYGRKPETISVCDFSFPGEQPLGMGVNRCPDLPYSPAKERKVTVHGHPDITLSLAPNANLIALLGEHPHCALTRSSDSKWQLQGSMPATPQMREQLYPALSSLVEGMTQYDAVALLLKVAQSFPYQRDDEVWGGDRVFFPDESWYYPTSDCEDHAIHFTRLVRDVLGLNCCLVLYPGHLASAVAITDGSQRGAYTRYAGRDYTLCDATYFYASPGEVAPKYACESLTLIPVPR